jgi:hypothetical protein
MAVASRVLVGEPPANELYVRGVNFLGVAIVHARWIDVIHDKMQLWKHFGHLYQEGPQRASYIHHHVSREAFLRQEGHVVDKHVDVAAVHDARLFVGTARPVPEACALVVAQLAAGLRRAVYKGLRPNAVSLMLLLLQSGRMPGFAALVVVVVIIPMLCGRAAITSAAADADSTLVVLCRKRCLCCSGKRYRKLLHGMTEGFLLLHVEMNLLWQAGGFPRHKLRAAG